MKGTSRKMTIEAIMIDKQRGAALSEFALAFIVLLMLVMGVLDFSNYLVQANMMQAAAYQAAAKAAWAPGFNLPESDPQFQEAMTDVEEDISGGINGRVQLVPTSGDAVVDYSPHGSGGAANFTASTNPVVLSLPALGSDNTRDGLMASQPIGVRINFRVRSLFGMWYNSSAEAWSFREPPTAKANTGPSDCAGRPLNVNNPPSADECGCEGQSSSQPGWVNPLTGHCGCDGGAPVAYNPQTGTGSCCDVEALKATCGPRKLLDYDNCECGQNCWTETGLGPWVKVARREDNTCGCTQINDLHGDAFTNCKSKYECQIEHEEDPLTHATRVKTNCEWTGAGGDCGDPCGTYLHYEPASCQCRCPNWSVETPGGSQGNPICACDALRTHFVVNPGQPSEKYVGCVCNSVSGTRPPSGGNAGGGACPYLWVDSGCGCSCPTHFLANPSDPSSGCAGCTGGQEMVNDWYCCPACPAGTTRTSTWGQCDCNCPQEGYEYVNGSCQPSGGCGGEGGTGC